MLERRPFWIWEEQLWIRLSVLMDPFTSDLSVDYGSLHWLVPTLWMISSGVLKGTSGSGAVQLAWVFIGYGSWTQHDDTAKHWFKFKPQRERSRKWEEPKKNSEVFEAAAQTEKLFAVRLWRTLSSQLFNGTSVDAAGALTERHAAGWHHWGSSHVLAASFTCCLQMLCLLQPVQQSQLMTVVIVQ